jgi:hypothetical protein
MSIFIVNSATYFGTGTDKNPKVYVQGRISNFNGYVPCVGLETNYSGNVFALLFWDQIQQANLAGGVSAVQALLAVEFMNSIQGPPFVSAPVVPASSKIPLPIMGTPNQQNATCVEAMAGTWAA